MRASAALRIWLAAALAALVLAALALWWRGGAAAAAPGTPPSRAAATGAAQWFAPARADGPVQPLSAAQRRRLLIEQLRLADQTYCSYRQATRYPPGARPASEQPDQLYPNAPLRDIQPLRREGGGASTRVQLQTTQSRVHLAAGESVALSLRALDERGEVLPLVVTRAQAQGLNFDGARPAPQVTLAFTEDGAGTLSGMLAPAHTALAGFEGTIRIAVHYSAGGEAGQVWFDVVYSPALPAIWSGPAREAFDDGALAYVLKAEVRQPGRYIVSGRLDDATGKPLALLSFNEVLPAGPAEIKLSAFGKLLRELAPAMPLTLRDVDGYLLKENADPDRALMPRLEGKVLTGQVQPLERFADSEWQSEERTRHLVEFGKDLERARHALAIAEPALAPPPSICVNNP